MLGFRRELEREAQLGKLKWNIGEDVWEYYINVKNLEAKVLLVPINHPYSPPTQALLSLELLMFVSPQPFSIGKSVNIVGDVDLSSDIP